MGSACYAVRVSRWMLALTLLLLPACESGAGQPDGALGAEQGTDGATSHPDHGTPVDGGGDGGGPDGGSTDGGGTDGSSTLDMGNPVGVPCSVQGVAGTCQLVSTCALMSTAGFCPGPADVRCCHPAIDAGVGTDQGTGSDQGTGGTCDPDDMPTPNAGLSEAPGVGGCPAGMLPVGTTFCVDAYEAFVRIDRGGSALPEDWSPFHHPPTLTGGQTLIAYSVAGAIPQGQISGIQAANACAGAGKRLCSNTEWLSACRGPDTNVYPYGDTRQPGVCNDARATHPAVEYFGTGASWIWSMLDHPCIAQIPNSLDATGANAGCVTDHGAFDMMGNLHEWTSDAAGTFRGGFFADTSINGNGCLYATTAHNTAHSDYSTGFRCCADL